MNRSIQNNTNTQQAIMLTYFLFCSSQGVCPLAPGMVTWNTVPPENSLETFKHTCNLVVYV